MRNVLCAACACVMLVQLSAWGDFRPRLEGKRVYVDGKVSVSGDGSQAQPFKSINQAIDASDAETTVVVRGGTYYETVNLKGQRRVKMIAAQPGETVILSGMKKVSQWRRSPGQPGVYVSDIDFIPTRLYVGMEEQVLARLPRSGWYQSSTSDVKDGMVCEELKKLDFPLASTQTFVWLQRGNVFGNYELSEMALPEGRIKFPCGKWTRLTNGDKFYLQNNPTFIASPGEWAFVKTGTGKTAKVFFRPKNPAQLKDVAIPFNNRAVLSANRGIKDFTLYGIDVVGGAVNGVEVSGENITIVNCRIYFNGRHGISARGNTGLKITGNQVWCNGKLGIAIHGSKKTEVMYNEIALNFVDGLVVSWKSSDIVIRKNYIHHHLFWGHPDNVQFYRTVNNVTFEENLLMAGGQGVMMEQCSNMNFINNVIAGTDAVMMIFGHGNANQAKIIRNTLAYSGFAAVTLTGKDYELARNIIVSGHCKPSVYADGQGIRSNENLLWNADSPRKMVISVGRKFYRSLEDFARDTGNDQQSIYAKPGFISAPHSSAVLNIKKMSSCTNAKLFFRYNGIGFKAGETVELNFDGIRRKVVEANKDYIVIDPPLKNAPIKCWIILNWGQQQDLNLDLRPLPDSPARKDGKQFYGSTIDINAYRRGEFNMDGKCLRPQIPSYVSDQLKRYQ